MGRVGFLTAGSLRLGSYPTSSSSRSAARNTKPVLLAAATSTSASAAPADPDNSHPHLQQDSNLTETVEAKHRFGGSILPLFARLRKFPRPTDAPQTWNQWFEIFFRILDHEAFNAVSAGRLIFSLVSCGKEDSRAFRIIQQRLRDTDFIEIWYKRTLPHIDQMDARSLATSIYSLGVLQQKPEETFLKRWYIHAEQKIETFNSQELSNSICSFARLGFRPDESFLEHWYSAASASLDTFNRQELANVIWSFGKILLRPDEQFFDKWLLAAEERLPDFYSQNLSNIFYSFSLLRIIPPASFHEQWMSAVKVQLPTFSNQDLSNVLFAMGKLQMEPDKEFLQLWLATAENRLSTFNRRDLTNSLQAFAALGISPPNESWADWLHASDDVMGTFNNQELANILYSFAKLGAPPDQTFLGHWFEIVEPKLDEFTTQGLSTSMYSLSRLDVRPPESFMKTYLSSVERNLGRLTNQAFCSVILSMAKLGITLTPSFEGAFLPEAEKRLLSFSSIDLSSILYSFDLLDLKPTADFMDMWWQVATAKMQHFDTHSCSNAMYSLSRLGYTEIPADFSAALVKQVDNTLSEFEAKGLAQMFWALGALNIPVSNRFLQSVWTAISIALPAFEPKGLATLITGMTRHRMSPPDFVEKEILVAARRSMLLSGSGGETKKILAAVIKNHEDKPEISITQAFKRLSQIPTRETGFMDFFSGAGTMFNHPDYTPKSMTRLIHLLAKFSKKSWKHEMAMQRFLRESTFLHQWYSGSDERLKDLDARQLANIIWALGVLKSNPPDEWLNRWFVCSSQTLENFDGQQLVNSMFAFSRLGVTPNKDFLAPWFQRSTELLQSFDCQTLGNCILALSRVDGVEMDESFASMWSDAVLAKSASLTNEDFSNVIFGAGLLFGQQTDQTWLDHLLVSAASQSTADKPRDLVKLIEGLYRMNFVPSRSQGAGLTRSLATWMPKLGASELVAVLRLLDTFGDCDQESVLEQWTSSAAMKLSNMNPIELSEVFEIVSRDKWASTSLEEFMGRLYFAVGDNLSRFGPAEISACCEGLQRYPVPGWFTKKFLGRIREIDNLPVRDTEVLARYIRCTHTVDSNRTSGLADKLSHRLRPGVSDLSPKTLIDAAYVLTHSNATGDLRALPVWSALMTMRPALSSVEVKSLQAVLSSLPDEGMIEEIADVIKCFD